VNVTPAAAQFGPTTPPARVFGNVSIAGRPAPGATVIALIGTSICGVATTAADGSYQVDVRSAATQAGCGIDGGIISFTVNGRTAPESAIFQSGGFIRRDLRFGERVAEVLVERWARYSDEPCAAPVDFWCVESVDVAPPITGTVWYRLLVRQPDGSTEEPTGFIPVSL
jgi:hypothetical protein